MEHLHRNALLQERDTGKKHKITFIIQTPTAEDEGRNYSCICEISGAPDIYHKVFGLDEIQAIELSIKFLQTEFDVLLKSADILYEDGTPMEFFSSPNS